MSDRVKSEATAADRSKVYTVEEERKRFDAMFRISVELFFFFLMFSCNNTNYKIRFNFEELLLRFVSMSIVGMSVINFFANI